MTSNRKLRSIRAYIHDYKMDNLYCQHCHKKLERITIVHKKQAIIFSAISDMTEKIDQQTWLSIKNELILLCRFCRNIYCSPENYFFDLKSFNQHLIETSSMTKMTIHEYVARLKRLDAIFLKAQFKVKTDLVKEFQDQFKNVMTSKMLTNYSIAISVYLKYCNSAV